MAGNHLLVEIPCMPGDIVWCIYENDVHKAVAARVIVSVYPNDKKRVQIEAEFEIADPFYDDGRMMKQGIYCQYGENVFLNEMEARHALAVSKDLKSASRFNKENLQESNLPYFL